MNRPGKKEKLHFSYTPHILKLPNLMSTSKKKAFSYTMGVYPNTQAITVNDNVCRHTYLHMYICVYANTKLS